MCCSMLWWKKRRLLGEGMFGLFGVTKDANKAHGYIANFASFTIDAVKLFGFSSAAQQVATSEWSAGPKRWNERGFDYYSARLAVPDETFFWELTNDTETEPNAETKAAMLTIIGSDAFLGFRLSAYGNREIVQVSANNPIDGKCTARATMLMSRFVAHGATDISALLR